VPWSASAPAGTSASRDLVSPRPADRSQLLTADGRAWLASIHLPAIARQAVDLALRMIDHLEVELDLLDTSWPASHGASQAAKRSSGAMGSVG
jgi:hypothetical protein